MAELPIGGKGLPLICSCCNLPFAYLRNGSLVIASRHHGDNHQNVISVQTLDQLLVVSLPADVVSTLLPGGRMVGS